MSANEALLLGIQALAEMKDSIRSVANDQILDDINAAIIKLTAMLT